MFSSQCAQNTLLTTICKHFYAAFTYVRLCVLFAALTQSKEPCLRQENRWYNACTPEPSPIYHSEFFWWTWVSSGHHVNTTPAFWIYKIKLLPGSKRTDTCSDHNSYFDHLSAEHKINFSGKTTRIGFHLFWHFSNVEVAIYLSYAREPQRLSMNFVVNNRNGDIA